MPKPNPIPHLLNDNRCPLKAPAASPAKLRQPRAAINCYVSYTAGSEQRARVIREIIYIGRARTRPDIIAREIIRLKAVIDPVPCTRHYR